MVSRKEAYKCGPGSYPVIRLSRLKGRTQNLDEFEKR
jgi:hypothetical protein